MTIDGINSPHLNLPKEPSPKETSKKTSKKLLAFATQGEGGVDDARLRSLLTGWEVEYFSFDRSSKLSSGLALFLKITQLRPSLVVMEGSGISGGLPLILCRILYGVPYVVSSGDAIGPYVASFFPFLGILFGIYERALCFFSKGFIGWTPYLVGRALTFGARRAMTVPGFTGLGFNEGNERQRGESRKKIREQLKIPTDAIVIGIVGSLEWNSNKNYCYGAELVQALLRVKNPKIYALIIGDGRGLNRLKEESQGSERVLLPGRIPNSQVPDYLSAMDVGSLPQSCDGVGSFRYTIKLSEYLEARLPIVTGQVPLSYDLDEGWIWRLPGDAPWDSLYIEKMADLLNHLGPGEIEQKRLKIPKDSLVFDRERQVHRVREFLNDLLLE